MRIPILMLAFLSLTLFRMEAMDGDNAMQVTHQNVGINRSEEAVDAGIAQNTRVGSSQKTLNVVIAISKDSIPAEFLPEGWYREIIEKKLVGDPQGEPNITLEIEDTLLPVVKEALYLMKVLEQLPDYKATQLAYKILKKRNFSLDQAATLIVTLDYLMASKPIISAMARIFAKLTQGNEPDLGFLLPEIRREINRYFYLLYDRYIGGEQEGDVWLQDLIKFKKIDLHSKIKGNKLNLTSLSLVSTCKLGKFLGFIAGASIFIIDLSGNKFTQLPKHFARNLPTLKELDLEKNKLTALPDDFCQECLQLEELGLNQNQLTSLTRAFARNWPALKILNLSDNKLTAFPDDFCQESSQLEELWLHGNQLPSLTRAFARNWPALKILNLADNKLAALPDDFCQESSQLEVLWLNGNQLKGLSEKLIHRLGQLPTLKLLVLQNDDLKLNIVQLEPTLERVIDVGIQ